ncbi:unnamed protein product [Adineta ricciae]|uniref:Uncharacterized protein n=1 Tax=Adineta ricciae TaxID=249248 RepID=A0A815SJ80_ADIRI|nr:unnamed protein product [Adineta ricciae]
MINIFVQNKHRIGHGQALEFGGGPALFSSFILAQYVNSITFTDYTPSNLKAIEDWIEQNDDAHDWTEMFEFIVDYYKESSNDQLANLNNWEHRLRDALNYGKRLKCADVNGDHCPVLNGQDRYDVILSSLCLDYACLTLETYKNTLKRMKNLLKPGGCVILTHGRNQTFYTVLDKDFFALPVDEKKVHDALAEAGFTDIQVTGIDKPRNKYADADGYVVACAFKSNEE